MSDLDIQDVPSIDLELEPINELDLEFSDIQVVEGMYQGKETDNIILTVDESDRSISATLKQVQFDSRAEFPEVGSPKLVYVDLSDNSLWIYRDNEYVSVSAGEIDLSNYATIQYVEQKENDLNEKIENNNQAIRDIKIPTTLAELTSDEFHRTVTDNEKKNWDEKVTQEYVDQKFDGASMTTINKIYPIGSIYLSVNNTTSPASLFGGVWEELPEGYALWTTNSPITSEEEGIDTEDTIYRKTPAGLPNVTGQLSKVSDSTAGWTATGPFYNTVDARSNTCDFATGTRYYNTKVDFSLQQANSIYGNSDTVQPPAYKVYAWKRVE